MQCMADWSFKLLENVLHKTSAAFHKIASEWLLDGAVEVKLPDLLIGCEYLVPKILEIGRNIQHLKRFRGQRSYEYKLEQRTNLIEDETLDKGALWYNIHQRGRLYSIVDQLSTTVSEDVMHELMERQRLLDHMLFVQAHFFMLRGEFTNAVQDAIREASAMDRKRTGFSAIPIPKKQTPSLIAEAA
uniref:Gamma-tubulin complex component n=1 Tax=Ditylenchus dipsaci TaxID=166011 RepID=A0A915E9U6_9BILA